MLLRRDWQIPAVPMLLRRDWQIPSDLLHLHGLCVRKDLFFKPDGAVCSSAFRRLKFFFPAFHKYADPAGLSD